MSGAMEPDDDLVVAGRYNLACSQKSAGSGDELVAGHPSGCSEPGESGAAQRGNDTGARPSRVPVESLHTSAPGKFAAIATQYACDVVDGRIAACKWARLACQRHLNDLARTSWQYTFNPELTDVNGKLYYPVERICKFAQMLPHIKGDWAARGERIRLEAWQVFVLASIFGWVHRDTRRRRFRIADLYVPRKNAKSTIAAVIGAYMLAADGEYGAEVYSGATSEDQAYEVFRPARLMAATTPEYCKHYGVTVNISNLAIVSTNSKFEPVIGKPGDGASPSCAIVDEYHEHKTSALYDTMETGMGARSQPLLLIITTAGSDISGPC